jgi:hypothetical protein
LRRRLADLLIPGDRCPTCGSSSRTLEAPLCSDDWHIITWDEVVEWERARNQARLF